MTVEEGTRMWSGQCRLLRSTSVQGSRPKGVRSKMMKGLIEHLGLVISDSERTVSRFGVRTATAMSIEPTL